MDKLVSIIRKPDELVALISRPRCEFKVTLSSSIDNSFSDLANHYECVETPLEVITNKLCPKKDKILSAWNYIKKVQILNEILLTQILLILLETQIDYSRESIDLPK